MNESPRSIRSMFKGWSGGGVIKGVGGKGVLGERGKGERVAKRMFFDSVTRVTN